MTEIDNQSKSIDSDTELIESNFDLTNESKLKVWYKKNQVFKITQVMYVDYGEIKSEIYLVANKPIKIIESESTFTIYNDSIAKIKGYDIGLEENFKASTYIFNWNKKQRELIITGEPTEKKISLTN